MFVVDWNQFWTSALTAIVPIILTGVGYLIKLGFGYLKEKINSIKNDQIRQGLLSAESEAERMTDMIVSSLNQTVVSALKEQNGGKLSPADALRIKNQAIANIKSLLSDESKNIIQNYRTDIEIYIGHLIESVISRQQQQSA